MSHTIQTLLEPPVGFRSQLVAAFFAGLDDQSRRLADATRGLTPEELAWQAAPGMNTIGMLLAHIAVAEVHLTDVGIRGLENSDVRAAIGIGIDDDGLPLPENGSAPAVLQGRSLEFYDGLLERARAHSRTHAMTLTDADLARQITRQRPDGNTRVFDVRWMVYHLLEHQAGHHAQILMLRHLHRASRATPVRGGG